MDNLLNIQEWVSHWIEKMEKSIKKEDKVMIAQNLREAHQSDIDWSIDVEDFTELHYYNLKETAKIILNRRSLVSLSNELQELNYSRTQQWK